MRTAESPHRSPTAFTAPLVAPLLPDEVHLWTVEILPGPNEKLLSAATVDEQRRAERFRNPHGGARYLAAHGALRLTLATYLQCHPHDIALRTRAFGKPFVVGSDLEFNLSHSGAMALIAVTRGRPVGVDIEVIRPISDQEGIFARIASPEEVAAFASIAPDARAAEFFRLWTRMEAACKVTGEGIGASSATRRVSTLRCRLVEVGDLHGYAACVAAEGFDWRLVRMPPHQQST